MSASGRLDAQRGVHTQALAAEVAPGLSYSDRRGMVQVSQQRLGGRGSKAAGLELSSAVARESIISSCMVSAADWGPPGPVEFQFHIMHSFDDQLHYCVAFTPRGSYISWGFHLRTPYTTDWDRVEARCKVLQDDNADIPVGVDAALDILDSLHHLKGLPFGQVSELATILDPFFPSSSTPFFSFHLSSL